MASANIPGAAEADDAPLPPPEPIVRFAKAPGRIELEGNDIAWLFDRSASPSYPHTGAMLNKAIASFLVDSTREQRRTPKVEVKVVLHSAPLRPEEEASARAQMNRFFSNEAELARLELRVNRSEGWGSARFSIPIILVAGLIAGLLSATTWVALPAGLLVALLYLIFITVVWVLLWDPVEKILFDGYIIRQRIRALHKLATASIVFEYRAMPVPNAGSGTH